MQQLNQLILSLISIVVLNGIFFNELVAQSSSDFLADAKRAYQSNPDSTIIYANKVIEIANKKNEIHEISQAYKYLGLAYHALKESDKAQQKLDKAIEYSKSVKDQEDVVKLQYNKAQIYSATTNFASATTYFKKVLAYSTENNDTSLTARVSLDFGIVYARKGEYYAALQYFLKSLDSFKQLEDIQYVSSISLNIGNIYREMGELEKALVYYEKVDQLLDDDGKMHEKIALIINFGLLYEQLEDYTRALEYYEKALKISEELDYASYRGLLYNNLAEVFRAQGNPNKAIAYFNKALPFREMNNNQDGLAKTLNGLAISNYELGNYSLALEQLNKALAISRALEDRESQSDVLKKLSTLHKTLGNDRLAYDFLQQHVELSDSLFNKNSVDEITRLEAEYKFKEEQLLVSSEVELLRKDKSLQKSRFAILLLSLIIVSLALITVYWIYYQNKKKTNLLEKDLENKAIIERQSQELEEASKVKSRFFTNISHELRTPLTLIGGPINNVLTKHRISKGIKQELNIAQKNVNQLKQLINQILDLSKLDFRELKINVSTFFATDLYNSLVEEFSSYATYQQIDFQFMNTISKDVALTTDGSKLFIVLKNLLSNAFKFTPHQGSIRFEWYQVNETIQIIVKDTGRGIHPDDLPYIFERYFQTKQINTSLEGGTGIGLTTVKEYIEHLGGKIEVESELGKGSTFKIVFPRVLNNDKMSLVSNSSLPFLVANGNNSTISLQNTYNPSVANNLLVIEDNINICHHLQSILQEEYNLTFSHNGQEALELLKKYQPNLIITDLMMPVMDGFEFLAQLKQNKSLRHIPVITLTARAQLNDKIKVLNIGIDDYISKPFHELELKASIQNLLANLESRLEYQESLNSEKQQESEQGNSLKSHTTVVNHPNKTLSKEDMKWLEQLQQETLKGIKNVDFNVNHLSAEMALSPSQLYRKIKLLTGLTPKNYMQQVRFHQARKLLEERSYNTVKAVAFSVGFKDEKYFSRVFKQRFGKYPSEYLVG